MRGDPRTVDEDEEALRLANPLVPDHVEDRGALLRLKASLASSSTTRFG